MDWAGRCVVDWAGRCKKNKKDKKKRGRAVGTTTAESLRVSEWNFNMMGRMLEKVEDLTKTATTASEADD